MRDKGNQSKEFLENLQCKMHLECVKYGHIFSQNGTISCVRCGKIRY